MALWHISRRHKVANGDLLVSMMLIQLQYGCFDYGVFSIALIAYHAADRCVFKLVQSRPDA